MDTFADDYWCPRCRTKYTKDGVGMNNVENIGYTYGVHVLKCVACNAEVTLSNVKFCPYCGSQNLVSDGISCPACGKQVHEDDNFCPNCAKPLRPNSPSVHYLMKNERVSNAWYLLPVFFSILGGIIGYVGVKERDSEKAGSILACGILIFVVEVVFVLSL
jgi:RNA polymerase subunit RPABC4/transcription elongation factor Spt4